MPAFRTIGTTNVQRGMPATDPIATLRAVTTPKLPELEPHCGSWIATPPHGGVPREFFERRNAQAALNAGWKVETAAQYLARVNAAIKTGAP